jgi:flagellar basal-body rod protein FlgB
LAANRDIFGEGAAMAISDIPILQMLRTRLQWSQERQRVLSENVANSDTPNYRARDLAPPKFEDPGQLAPTGVSTVSLTRTENGHIAALGSSGSTFRTETKGNYEVRPTGNAVNIEDEMMKVAANQMDYQAATALYTRSLGLFKTALGRR